MGQRIDQFCEQLRTKLTQIDIGLQGLKDKIDSQARSADQDARTHLDKVQKRIAHDQSNVTAAQAKMKDWIEARKVETQVKIAEWKSKRETSKLMNNRADRAEEYAAAAIVVAYAAVDEAERASVEALLARQDAEAVPVKQAANA